MNRKRKATTLSVPQLYKMFPDEPSCYAWLEETRWQDRRACPHCGGVDDLGLPPASKPHHYWCKPCRKHFTVTTGTCLHSTKKPLQDWIYAIYSVLTARKGISAMQLSKELGCQYRTAWHMLHRIRGACNSGAFTLQNIVEVDETYFGGKEKNKHNRKKLKAGRGGGGVGKQAVIGARERGGAVRAKVINNTDGATLKGFIHDTVEAGSTVYTDEHKGYNDLGGLFYQHGTVKHSAKEYVNGMAHTNGIESVWAVLKRGYYGTFHHISTKHLQRYVDEFTFRLNEGNVEIDTLDRMASLCKNIGGRNLPYRKLVA